MRLNNHKTFGGCERNGALWAPLAAKEGQKQRRKEKKKRQQTSAPFRTFRHIPSHGTIRYDENGSVNSGDAVYVLDTLKNRLRPILTYNLAFELMEKIACVWYKWSANSAIYLPHFFFWVFFFFFPQFCDEAKMAIIIHKLINIAKFGYTLNMKRKSLM
jgi:hypothetical protein